jgi:hypothetical protein
MKTIYANTQVGIYDNCQYIARIYRDKIIVTSPTVRWVGNTGGYHETKEAIRDQAVVDAVAADYADDCIESAWHKIGRVLDNDFLANL